MPEWLALGIGIVAGGALVVGALLLSLRPILPDRFASSSDQQDSFGPEGSGPISGDSGCDGGGGDGSACH